jgi:hypothetical protein
MRKHYLTKEQRNQIYSKSLRMAVPIRKLSSDELSEYFKDHLNTNLYYNQSRSIDNCQDGTIELIESLKSEYPNERKFSIEHLLKMIDSHPHVKNNILVLCCFGMLEKQYTDQLDQVSI